MACGVLSCAANASMSDARTDCDVRTCRAHPKRSGAASAPRRRHVGTTSAPRRRRVGATSATRRRSPPGRSRASAVTAALCRDLV
eukprot:2344771-Pyramimonas_sp.AAC.1